jgi:pimeloyl-ACP methyl ester carboxylesterase
MNLNRFLILLALLAVCSYKLSAQGLPVKTAWEGKLNNINIILRLSTDSITKQQTAVFDIPQQGAINFAVSQLSITNDTLYAFCPTIPGSFTGGFNADKTVLTGYWKQAGRRFPLSLTRATNVPMYNRPQMPKPPYPYQEEKVVYYNKDRSIQYGATLTLPRSAKKLPAVILITGSGQQDRDETTFGHKLFWVIADHLSRNGIAVLRVDDRGIGQTTGEVMNATSASFAKDVLVGIDYLKTHQGIDTKNIGLLGHSEGGMIAPLVAVQSTDVAFIVSMAGIGVKGFDITVKQNLDGYRAAGFNEEELSRVDSYLLMINKLSIDYPNDDSLKIAYERSIKQWLGQQPEPFLKKLGFKGPGADRNIDMKATMFFLPWMRYFMQYDPATTLTKITIPVLALNGSKDVQVSATENLAGFNTLLTQAGNKNFKTVLMPNLNHFFQTASTGAVSEYMNIEETISPEALNIITEWIKGLKRRK